ncbi:MAG: VOC family protein [Alphaproteobacteria bacterium]|nr:VOC family protein [Alphaproteobacteria bacterium]
MGFRVERIDHVVLAVRDVAAMERFYTAALGFTVERRLERLGLVQMRAGASMLDLVPAPAERGPGRNMDHLCFRIEPFDPAAIRATLKPLGVSVGEAVERCGAEGNGLSVYFTDPEGNTIELKGPPL